MDANDAVAPTSNAPQPLHAETDVIDASPPPATAVAPVTTEPADNTIRVTHALSPSVLLERVTKLIRSQQHVSLVAQAVWIPVAIAVAEAAKRRVALHQVSDLVLAPDGRGGASLRITLYAASAVVDASLPGYQAPLPASEVRDDADVAPFIAQAAIGVGAREGGGSGGGGGGSYGGGGGTAAGSGRYAEQQRGGHGGHRGYGGGGRFHGRGGGYHNHGRGGGGRGGGGGGRGGGYGGGYGGGRGGASAAPRALLGPPYAYQGAAGGGAYHNTGGGSYDHASPPLPPAARHGHGHGQYRGGGGDVDHVAVAAAAAAAQQAQQLQLQQQQHQQWQQLQVRDDGRRRYR